MRIIGIGNELRRDDGFGPTVARALAGRALPDGVSVQDYGTRVVHLAFDLADATGTTVFLDAAELGAAPGTVSVVEPSFPEELPPAGGHDLDLAGVVATVRRLGGRLEDIVLVGCQPLDVSDGVGLSAPVAAAVDAAVEAVMELALQHAEQHAADDGRLAVTAITPGAPSSADTTPTDEDS